MRWIRVLAYVILLVSVLETIATASCDWTGIYQMFQHEENKDSSGHVTKIYFDNFYLDLKQTGNTITGRMRIYDLKHDVWQTADLEDSFYYDRLPDSPGIKVNFNDLSPLLNRDLDKTKKVHMELQSLKADDCVEAKGYWQDKDNPLIYVIVEGVRESQGTARTLPPISYKRQMSYDELGNILYTLRYNQIPCKSARQKDSLPPGSVIFWRQVNELDHATVVLSDGSSQIEMGPEKSDIIPSGSDPQPNQQPPYQCVQIWCPPSGATLDMNKAAAWNNIDRQYSNIYGKYNPDEWNCWGFAANVVKDIVKIPPGPLGSSYVSPSGKDMFGITGGAANTGSTNVNPNGKNIYQKTIEASTENTFIQGPEGKGYHKGNLLAGPISIPANRNKPMDILYLDAGKAYIIVGEGVCSLWSDHIDGVDSCFCYAQWRCPDKPQAWGLLELTNPAVHLSDLIGKDAEGNQIYSSSHVYEAVVTGEGKTLQARVYDGGGYDDNNGELRISIYEAIPA